jgi:hypothetical protein
VPKFVANITANKTPPKTAEMQKYAAVFFIISFKEFDGNATNVPKAIIRNFPVSVNRISILGKNIKQEYKAITVAEQNSLATETFFFRSNDVLYNIMESIRKFNKNNISM